MADDPIVEEVRAIREKRAARFNFDIDAIVEDAIRRQGKDGSKVVSRHPKRPAAARTETVPVGARR